MTDAPRSAPLLARLLPEEPPARARWYDVAALVWLAGSLVVVLRVFRDYGITWDEAPHLAYGTRIFNWYTSGFTDAEALTFRINYFYGGGYDLLGAVFRRFAEPMEMYAAIHLLGGLVGVLGFAGTWLLARALAGPRAGLLALVMLTLHPIYFGHMFNNPKDEPFAVAYVWSLYFMVKAIAGLPRPSRAVLAKAAVAIGLALSVRIAGILLLCYLALVLFLYAVHGGYVRRSGAALLAYVRRMLAVGVGVTAGAWVVMLIGWPWAQMGPLHRPFIALTRMSSFDAHQRRMPFAGEYVWSQEIGWPYLPHYFGLQTPEYLLVLLFLGTLWGVASLLGRDARGERVRQALALLLLGMAVWLPPLYAMLKGSPLYDGYRHFLFVVPPLVALAAVTLDAGVAKLQPRLGRASPALALVVALPLGDMLVHMVRLHPHEATYFNRFIGGLPGAVNVYDTDYYGNSFREAMRGLQRHVWNEDRKAYLETIWYFSGCVSGRTTRHYVPGNFRSFKHRRGPKLADFHVGYLRYRCDQRFPDAPVIFEVERFGAVLNVAKDLRGLPDALRTQAGANRRLSGKKAAAVDEAEPDEAEGEAN